MMMAVVCRSVAWLVGLGWWVRGRLACCGYAMDRVAFLMTPSLGLHLLLLVLLTCYPLVARYYIINLVLLVQSSSVMGCDRLVKVAISSAVCGASLNQHGLLLISHFLWTVIMVLSSDQVRPSRGKSTGQMLQMAPKIGNEILIDTNWQAKITINWPGH